MLVKELFAKPIDRPINGVIKADQADSASVWQELDEYVVTRELDVHFRRFFGAFLEAIDRTGDPSLVGLIGVWISGFFGSGKSHFLKILSYLLENREITWNGRTKRAIEFFDGKIQDAMLAADIKRAVGTEIDVILFNIDSKADSGSGRDAILRVFLKVFNEKLGYSGDHPHIADLERRLAAQDQLDSFKAAFHALAHVEWEQERDAYSFYADELVQALAETLGKSAEGARSWLDKAEEDFRSRLNVENFARWVKDYLDSRSPQHRLLFLVDEIGGFIGDDTHLMLNLQTITENLGTICGGRAWVVVTSQEDIDAVIGEVRASKANDFSKIQGRFKTRLSLSSANVDEVIRKRLLNKDESVQAALTQVYEDQADILRHQLSFTNVGMTFKPYADARDFVSVYPFAPYQFQLMQKVFEAIRRHGVTGLHLARGERSMLDAFQSAAIQVADEAVGVLIPLYRFYPSIESFLEGVVKSTIDHAADNDRLEPIDVQVLKTLFLIRYVDEIRGHLDNLVTLFIDCIDADRLVLRQRIEGSLQRLEKETLVGRNGEDFFFLTNEERDISREIKDIDLSAAEETKFLGELIFEEVYKGLRKHRFPDNNKDFGLTRLCDLHPHGSRTEGDLIVSVITPLADDYGLYSDGKCTLDSAADGGQLLIRLDDDKTLSRELRTWLQTDKYVVRKHDGTASTTTLRILRERQEENRERRQRLIHQLEERCKEAHYYAVGQHIQPKGGSAASVLTEALNYLIRNSFNKLGYLARLSANPQAEIKAVLNATDVDELGFSLEAGQGNQQALAEVQSTVGLMASANRPVILEDLVENRFGRRPYGWPEWEVVLLVARLVRRGDFNLVSDGAVLPIDRVYDAVITPSKWKRLLIIQRQTVDQGRLQSARQLAREVFGQLPPDGEEALDGFLREHFGGWRTDLTQYQPLTASGDYPGSQEIAESLGVIAKLLAESESFGLISRFLERRDDLLDLSESVHELRHFYQTQRSAWDRLRQAHSRFQLNRDWLEQDAGAKPALQRMQEILAAPAPYGMIKEVEGLIERVEQVNAALVEQHRTAVLPAIDAQIDKIQVELDEAKAGADVRNRCLYPLQQLKSQVESQASLAHIDQAARRAVELADSAFSRIESLTPPAPTLVNDKGGPSPKPVVVKSKPRRILRAAELAPKTYLETQDDIDAYLNKLRQVLESAIANHERVEIR
ncbi:BREX system P-loop protein BrxC [Allochromatium humboldtianum]|uniref:BREX system P-loop protein BrxC n=1 Tax=Allochromatium humboldtianum TaxID=504901 RepID=A0A850RBX8_9GAMM|nr:BREX system P-loop protein BrxC [Allochromatium humboldtianum]NVZ09786.1 BREX system P-loop protein BrxC [Allochromatium humboldtianum]